MAGRIRARERHAIDQQRRKLRGDGDGERDDERVNRRNPPAEKREHDEALTNSAGPIANANIAARTPDQYDAEGNCECTRNAHAAFNSVGMTNDARRPTTIQ